MPKTDDTNGIHRQPSSRVGRDDAATFKVVWEYQSDPNNDESVFRAYEFLLLSKGLPSAGAIDLDGEINAEFLVYDYIDDTYPESRDL